MTETCEHLHIDSVPAESAVNVQGYDRCEDCGELLLWDVDAEEWVTEMEKANREAEIQRRVSDPNDPWNVSEPLPAGIFPNEEPPF